MAAAVAGVGIALVNAHTRSRDGLQDIFEQRQTVAAALFGGLFAGSGSLVTVTPDLKGARVTAAALRAHQDPADSRVTVFAADGTQLASELQVRSAPLAPAEFERRLVTRSLHGPVTLSDIYGPPSNPAVDMATTFLTRYGQRVEVAEFSLDEISGLLPRYMAALAQGQAKASLVDSAGRIIASSMAAQRPGTLTPDTALMRAVRARPTGLYRGGGTTWYYSSSTVPVTDWKLVLEVPEAVLYSSISGPGQVLPFVLLALLAVGAVWMLILVKRVRRESQLHAKANVTLERSNLEIKEANDAKDRFLAGMSHELRTPLNGILGFTEMMYDGKVAPELQHEILGDVLLSARHLLSLIDDVLDISKVAADKMEFHPKMIDAGQVAREVRTAVGPLAAERQIEISLDVSAELGLVWLDPGKLRQVLFNYVSNAIKFTPPGGRIRIGLELIDGSLLGIEVEDTGIGISPEDTGKLFSDFGRLGQPSGESAPGTGLGLSLTKRIVEAQGGTVGVRSELGAGSVFSATLRCVAPAAAAPHEGDAARSPDALGVSD